MWHFINSAQGTEVSVILEYDAASLGDWFQAVREDVVVVNSGVGTSQKNRHDYFFLIVSCNGILVHVWYDSFR